MSKAQVLLLILLLVLEVTNMNFDRVNSRLVRNLPCHYLYVINNRCNALYFFHKRQQIFWLIVKSLLIWRSSGNALLLNHLLTESLKPYLAP